MISVPRSKRPSFSSRVPVPVSGSVSHSSHSIPPSSQSGYKDGIHPVVSKDGVTYKDAVMGAVQSPRTRSHTPTGGIVHCRGHSVSEGHGGHAVVGYGVVPMNMHAGGHVVSKHPLMQSVSHVSELLASQSSKRYRDYELHEQIGAGTFGVVFRCSKRPNFNMSIVMKVIDMAKMNREQIEANKKEVTVMQSVAHPHIVKYIDSFVSEETNEYCIVMEYCDGGDLANKIEGALKFKSVFGEETILKWLVQLLLALEKLHSNHILHRDLKPSNVYLTKSGSIKLGDFGIAKELNQTIAMASTVVGTPFSLSPELCRSIPYSYASDIWGIGCILFELMTLKKPFEGKNLMEVVWNIVETEPDYSSCSHYSLDLQNFLKMLLQKNPDARPNIQQILTVPFLQSIFQIVREEDCAIAVCPSSPNNDMTNAVCPDHDSVVSLNEEFFSNLNLRNENGSKHRPSEVSVKASTSKRQSVRMTLPSRDLIVGSTDSSQQYRGKLDLNEMYGANVMHYAELDTLSRRSSKVNSISSSNHMQILSNKSFVF